MEKNMVTIQPLCPELCEDWLGFFEKIADMKYVKVVRKNCREVD